MLQLFTVFHLNLAYSSIEEEDRYQVIQRCYWPLLRLAERHQLALGIEAPAHTLEATADLDPAFVRALRELVADGPCEFIGSGYVQLIGPLVPSAVNAANLRHGQRSYERLLGFRPQIALVNEQTYSGGLVRHYLDAGYRAIVTEWDNPARYHREWDPTWRYLPQIACGEDGAAIPLVWNTSIAFQKFQRFAHGELELDDYLAYLASHLAESPRAFSLYGNDVEIFDFRPGRYHTEAAMQEDGEWRRIERLFQTVASDQRFRLVRPSQVLDLMSEPGAGNPLRLGSAEEPIPVKKQGKYNVTRWAVTGPDDLAINTACWRAYAALAATPAANDDEWREICYLWSSDFRTHITEGRWRTYQARLAAFERKCVARRPAVEANAPRAASASTKAPEVSRDGHLLTVEDGRIKLRVNCRRGLAIDGLWFKDVSPDRLCGTLPHGYYDDIRYGADFYSGHLVFETPGRPKLADLNPVEPVVREDASGDLIVEANVATPLGPVRKSLRVMGGEVELQYELEWPEIPYGSLRLGHITLNPAAFDPATLFYRCHNGGSAETFRIDGARVDHGEAVSFLVSASHALGLTEGIVEIGDATRVLRVEVDKAAACVVGMITHEQIGKTYFCRLALSAGEADEARHMPATELETPVKCRLRLSAARTE